MKRKIKYDRLLWLSLLVLCTLGFYPQSRTLRSPQGKTLYRSDHARLPSNLNSGSISGQVHLQGRSSNAGVEVHIQSQSSPEQGATRPQNLTAQGTFYVEAQGTLLITAKMPGYLDSQTTVTVKPDEPLELEPTILYGGDVTGDNLIDISDLTYMGSRFGGSGSSGDVNGDNLVDISDLTMAAANFMMAGPTPWTSEP